MSTAGDHVESIAFARGDLLEESRSRKLLHLHIDVARIEYCMSYYLKMETVYLCHISYSILIIYIFFETISHSISEFLFFF